MAKLIIRPRHTVMVVYQIFRCTGASVLFTQNDLQPFMVQKLASYTPNFYQNHLAIASY